MAIRRLGLIALATFVALSFTKVDRARARIDTPAWKTVQKSIVVVGYAKGRIFESYGTGFCIKSGANTSVFLTADHVVHPQDHRLHAPSEGYRLVVLVPGSQPVAASDAGQLHSADSDLAVVSVPIGGVPAVAISPTLPEQTQGIAAGGFPYTEGVRFGGLFSGDIAGLTSVALPGSVDSVHNVLIAYSLTKGIAPEGTSGGPLFDAESGSVYGVVKAYVPDKPVVSAVDRARLGLDNLALTLSSSYTNLAISRDVMDAFLNSRPLAQQAVSLPSGAQTTSASAGQTSDAAVTLLQLSASQGDSNADNTLGLLYQYGIGVPKQYQKALGYFQLAADRGDGDGYVNLGIMHVYGYGVPPDEPAALRYFQLAADRGNATGENNLGLLYVLRGLLEPSYYAKAVHHFQLSADKGNSTGRSALATMYEYGQGVPQDNATALQYYGLAAALGSTYALRRVGCLYENGPSGVPRNYATALHYYGLAAAQGDYFSQYYAGLIYRYGHGVPPDTAKAAEYFRRAQATAQAAGVTQFDIPELDAPDARQNGVPCQRG